MKLQRTACGLLLAVVLGGCSAAPAPMATHALPAAAPAADVSKRTVFTTQYAFDDEASASAELAQRTADAVLGEGWLHAVPSFKPVLPASALVTTKQGSNLEVKVLLSAALLAEWLEQFERAPLEYLGPAQWKQDWLAALATERAALLCQRRQDLLQLPCSTPPTSGREGKGASESAPVLARVLLPALAESLLLEPGFPDGVPVDSDGQALWPARVRVWHRTDTGLEPLAGLPLSVEVNAAVEASDLQLSDANGNAQLRLPQGASGARVLAFEAGILGPLAAYWPVVETEVFTRSLQRARCSVVARGRDNADVGSFERGVQHVLSAALGAQPTVLSAELAADVAHTEERVVPGPLVERLVAATEGKVDYLAKVEMESEFASQMGNGRTWYEARAHVKLIELWSGKLVDVFELSATESGIGDNGAQAAACERLGALVGERLARP